METSSINKLKQIAELKIDITNEQNVKHNIVIPFLECFGFNTLSLEHSSQGSRTDINMHDDKIIIETKSSDKELDVYVEKLKEYCDKEKPTIAIISNGNEFKIYSPLWRKKLKIFHDTVIYFFERKQLTDMNLINRLEKILSKDEDIEDNVTDRENELMKIYKDNEQSQNDKKNTIKQIELEISSDENKIKLLQENIKDKNIKIEEINNEIEVIALKIKKDNYLPYKKFIHKDPNEIKTIVNTIENTNIEENAEYVLYNTKIGLKAQGFYLDKRFIVKEGSIFIKKVSDHFSKLQSLLKKRNYLIKNGILELREDSYYILTQNHEFNSISQAAGVILGRSSDGKKEFLKK